MYQHVMHPAHIFSSTKSWSKVLHEWLDGQVLTEESVQYIRNFLNVVQCRPQNSDEAVGNSDECISDEECNFVNSDLKTLLRTALGGQLLKDANLTDESLTTGDTEDIGLQEQALQRCCDVWNVQKNNATVIQQVTQPMLLEPQ